MALKSHSSGNTVATITAILLVVYVLSPVPVAILLTGSVGSYAPHWVALVFNTIYAPISFAADHVALIDDFYEWYASLIEY